MKLQAEPNGHALTNGAAVIDDIGDAHIGTSTDTPLREDAFELSDEVKMRKIEEQFESIMEILGLDLTDDSLKGTPRRVAKMFVKEIFQGLNPDNKPSITLFDNKYNYKQMLVEKNIRLQSTCEHHFLPIYGVAHVAYISSGKVIGLSKLNRLVDFFARRPQVQERLTVQIGEELKEALSTEDVAVMIDAKHMCVQCRGVEHQNSSTVTTFFSGKFLNEHTRQEFYQSLQSKPTAS